HVVLVDLLRVVQRHALEAFREQRRGSLRDRTSAAVKPDVLDHAVLDLEVDADHIAAEGVVLLVGNVRVLEPAEVPRVLVVVEDVLSIELVVSRNGAAAHLKILWASLMEPTRRSTSSFSVYT